MNCLVCGYIGQFGQIENGGVSHDGYGACMIGRMPDTRPVPGSTETRRWGPVNSIHCGSVSIYVCPECGALHSDMRGMIARKDRV